MIVVSISIERDWRIKDFTRTTKEAYTMTLKKKKICIRKPKQQIF